MNADEVCRMIDIITDGGEYVYTLDKGEQVSSDETGVLFWAESDQPIEVTDPRRAREIAGLLVAWAAFKEKSSDAGP